jgi:hypothetical protein
MGDNDTIVCQRAGDELRVVISKTLRTSANGICQMPAGNVPINAIRVMAEAIRGARSNMMPKNKTTIRNQLKCVVDIRYVRLWGNSQP